MKPLLEFLPNLAGMVVGKSSPKTK